MRFGKHAGYTVRLAVDLSVDPMQRFGSDPPFGAYRHEYRQSPFFFQAIPLGRRKGAVS